jgi:hypothetical protein
MKNQTIGIEIEMTNISISAAAETVAVALGVPYRGGADIRMADGRVWKCVRDLSIQVIGGGACELVSPILKYDDIPLLQEIIRALAAAGAKSEARYKCGIHVHVGANRHTPLSLRNLVNLMAAKEELIYKSLAVDSARVDYCKKVNTSLLERINAKKPATLAELGDIWYHGWEGSRDQHYHRSRYVGLNLHSVWDKGTVEFRLFNGTLHAGRVRSYIVFALAVSAQAIRQKSASPARTIVPNEKYAYRCWLLRLGLSGEEFKNCREHLMANLSGDAAWLDPASRRTLCSTRTPRVAQPAASQAAESLNEWLSAAAAHSAAFNAAQAAELPLVESVDNITASRRPVPVPPSRRRGACDSVYANNV